MGRQRDTRTEILRAATALFSRRGFDGISVRELVDAVGVTKPVLYYHFGNKEGLFRAAVDEQVVVLRRLVGQAVDASGSVERRLTMFAQDYTTAALGDVDGVRLLMRVEQAPEALRLHEGLTDAYVATLRSLADIVSEGQRLGQVRASVDPLGVVIALLGACNLNIRLQLSSDGQVGCSVKALFEHFFCGVAT